MSQASQRHKLEVRDMADTTVVADGTVTITLTGTFEAGVELIAFVSGDSTGTLSARTRLATKSTATEAATALATAIAALTGFAASNVAGVITVAIEAPNASVTADNAYAVFG